MRDRYIGRAVIGAFLLWNAGCTTTQSLPPQQREVTVVPGPPVPVPVYCAEDSTHRPAFVDTDAALAAIPDVEAGSKLYRAAVVQYRFWVKSLEDQFRACGKVPE